MGNLSIMPPCILFPLPFRTECKGLMIYQVLCLPPLLKWGDEIQRPPVLSLVHPTLPPVGDEVQGIQSMPVPLHSASPHAGDGVQRSPAVYVPVQLTSPHVGGRAAEDPCGFLALCSSSCGEWSARDPFIDSFGGRPSRGGRLAKDSRGCDFVPSIGDYLPLPCLVLSLRARGGQCPGSRISRSRWWFRGPPLPMWLSGRFLLFRFQLLLAVLA